jgi:hypothetical protein
MAPQAILVSYWPIFFKSSPKPLGQMNRILVGSIYGRSSIKIGRQVMAKAHIALGKVN